MKRDEITRIAEEAKIQCFDKMYVVTEAAELERFAKLVAAAERERCAQLCESYAMPDGTSETALMLAAAIRRMK